MAYFDSHYPQIEKVMEREKFAVDFSIASGRERGILVAAAKIESNSFAPSELKIKNVRPRLNDMIRKNLIVKLERGEYALYHPLFKEYLQKIKEA